MRIILYAISVLLFISFGVKAQQSPDISQYVIHQPFVNTAAITKSGAQNGALIFKQQWIGYEGAPSSLFMNFNMPLKSPNRFAGILVTNDNIGIHNNVRLSGIYAHKFRIDRTSFFSLSAAPGLEFIQSDYNQIQTDFSDDPTFQGSATSLFSMNMGAGAFYFNKKFYAGLALPTLLYNHFEPSGSENKGTIGFDVKQIPLNLTGGWEKDLGKFFSLQPSFLLKYEIASAMQIDINAMVEYREMIGFGLSYRTTRSLNIMANYRISKLFKIGYAFNTQVGSQLGSYHSGTHEVALLYGMENGRQASINLPKKIKKYRKKKIKARKKALKKLQKETPKLSPGGKREKEQPYS